ncbi:MAG: carbohydrate ABC transporter permease [Defluviitaleaceae bacterium]|nr:carbohydrate ABC transporter permease [Defluviitaleaceae bacterium]
MRQKFNIFDVTIYLVLIIIACATLYPFLNAVAISFNEANDTIRGGITIFPRQPTLANYRVIFSDQNLLNSYWISIARTIIGTTSGVLFTALVAYGMSKRSLIGRNIYMKIFLVTMFVSGGLIPYYMLIRQLGLMNNFLVFIIPPMFSVWNMIIMRTYFANSVPAALEESALIDGAGYYRIFFSIILHISKPIIATMVLFTGVFHWNSWFDAAIFITNPRLRPAQNVLIAVINANRFEEAMSAVGHAAFVLSQQRIVNVRSITMATMVATIIPIILVYPFVQKYFVKGIMIGSLKE